MPQGSKPSQEEPRLPARALKPRTECRHPGPARRSPSVIRHPGHSTAAPGRHTSLLPPTMEPLETHR